MSFELLCDIEVVFGLIILLPLLEEMNILMKSTQIWIVLVIDHVVAINLCQANMFSHFVDHDIAFKSDVFYYFKSLLDSSHNLFIMQWILDPNTSKLIT